MMRKSLLLILISLFLVISIAPVKAQRDPNTANFWLDVCRIKDSLACVAFVVGNHHGLGYAATNGGYVIPYCEPKGVENSQRVDIFRRYLEAHLEHRHRAAGALYVQAIREAFPCKR